jgi:DNA-binding response OmpR family regulator
MYFEPLAMLFPRFKQGLEQPLLVQDIRLQPFLYTAEQALIIENDTETRDALVDAIASSGIRVDRAADGETAVGYLSRQTYDVVILDLALPKISGMDIMEHLACTNPRTLANMIVLTSVEEAPEIRRLFPGVRYAFAKPVILSRLLQSVQTCIAAGEEQKSASTRKQTA